MSAKVLLGCTAFVLLAVVESQRSIDAQGVAQNVNVDVTINCLANRGVSFSLTPWAIRVQEGDSLSWRLTSASSVSEMEVIGKFGKPWPFRSRPPYKSTKTKAAGAKSLEAGQKSGRYQYAVAAVCVRDSITADTVIIDPDIIIIRGGGT